MPSWTRTVHRKASIRSYRNDDALRAIRLFASVADAILEGRQVGTEGGVTAATEAADADDAPKEEVDISASLAKAGVTDPDEGEDDVETEDEAESLEAAEPENDLETVQAPEASDGSTEESSEATAS